MGNLSPRELNLIFFKVLGTCSSSVLQWDLHALARFDNVDVSVMSKVTQWINVRAGIIIIMAYGWAGDYTYA